MLYGELLNSNNSPKVLHSLQTISSTSFLIDYTEIIRLLDSDSEACRKIALNLVLLDKPYYEPEDVNKLKIISEKIQQVFKPLSLITKKKMFLGGEKDVWECRCGQTNVVADWEYCQKCENDIYGFKENEPKPDDVALLVADRLIFLDDMSKASG